jgi:hypothetical protein
MTFLGSQEEALKEVDKTLNQLQALLSKLDMTSNLASSVCMTLGALCIERTDLLELVEEEHLTIIHGSRAHSIH